MKRMNRVDSIMSKYQQTNNEIKNLKRIIISHNRPR